MTLPPFDAPSPDQPRADHPSAHEPPATLPRSARSRAFFVAILAAAATSGAVLGFGIRAGTPSRAFNAIAALVIGDRARGVWGWDRVVTPVGITLLVTVMLCWGFVFARLAGGARGWRLIAIAAGIGLAAWMLSTAAFAQLGEPTRVMGPGQLAGLHFVLAVTLAVGMRLALGGPAHDE
ncbi:MAG TPA: hypothetical protein VFT96_11215 [Gemmatimonadaceae bacterium]|nr:hypothetical protein [Gemmatimonadaceae bacterium]